METRTMSQEVQEMKALSQEINELALSDAEISDDLRSRVIKLVESKINQFDVEQNDFDYADALSGFYAALDENGMRLQAVQLYEKYRFITKQRQGIFARLELFVERMTGMDTYRPLFHKMIGDEQDNIEKEKERIRKLKAELETAHSHKAGIQVQIDSAKRILALSEKSLERAQKMFEKLQ